MYRETCEKAGNVIHFFYLVTMFLCGTWRHRERLPQSGISPQVFRTNVVKIEKTKNGRDAIEGIILDAKNVKLTMDEGSKRLKAGSKRSLRLSEPRFVKRFRKKD